MSVNTLKERAKWAIDYIVKKEHLSNIKLSMQMGFAAGTINSYRRMTTDPSIEFILKFCELFKFNVLWFVLGEGYPFLGARETYPESKGPNPISTSPPDIFDDHLLTLREPKAGYGAPAAEQKISIEEAVGKAYKILSSGTALSVALYLNIQQFAAALDSSQELKACRDEISELKAQILESRRQVDSLTAAPSTATEQTASLDKKAV